MRIFQVDAFAREPFRGNPAAVCLLEDDPSRDEAWMQSLAAEMNLAETAFVGRRADGQFDLRWFTPTVEVALCGHATLASAHVLWQEGETASRLMFHTLSGVLDAERADDDGAIQLDFPADPVSPIDPTPLLVRALGREPVAAGRGRQFLLAELADAAAVRTLRPDLAAVAALDAEGLIATAAGDRGCDFVSRFFAPSLGIDEDPVTGAAHCCLAPYWQERLGRARLQGYQASTRGGFVGVETRGDRVLLIGHAVTVLRGELMV